MDSRDLERKIALPSTRLGGVSLGEHGQHTGRAKLPSIQERVGRPTGDSGIDAEPSIQLEARFFNLRSEGCDVEFNARDPSQRRRGGALSNSRPNPPQRQGLSGRRRHGEKFPRPFKYRVRLAQGHDVPRPDARRLEIDRRRREGPGISRGEGAISPESGFLPVRRQHGEVAGRANRHVLVAGVYDRESIWFAHETLIKTRCDLMLNFHSSARDRVKDASSEATEARGACLRLDQWPRWSP